jgi:hypothetical protein
MSIFSAIGHAFEHVATDVEHGVEDAAKGFLTGGPLGAVAGGLAGAGIFSAIGDVASDVEHGVEDVAKGVEQGVEGVAQDVEQGFQGLATGFLSGGPLGAILGGAAGLLGGLDQPADSQPNDTTSGQLPSSMYNPANTYDPANLYNPAANPLSPYSPSTLGSDPGLPNGIAALLQQAEGDLSQIQSLIDGGGLPSTTPIGDNSGLGGSCPFQSSSPFGNQGGAPVPFTPTQTNQKAQLIADAQFIAQNSANPAEASQVAQAQNDIQYREANIVSNASLISHSNVPASVLQGAMNQIVSDASSGNEANLVGDLNQLSSDIRSGQTPVGQQIYSA